MRGQFMQYSSGKFLDLSVLLLGIVLILLGSANYVFPPNRTPDSVPVVVPVVPDKPIIIPLEQYIYYDEYEKVLQLSKQHNIKAVLIFGSTWCVHCKELKKTLDSLYKNHKVLVCVIDIGKDKKLIEPYKVSGLPTSIVVDKNNKELTRKVGYVKTNYEKWLNENL